MDLINGVRLSGSREMCDSIVHERNVKVVWQLGEFSFLHLCLLFAYRYNFIVLHWSNEFRPTRTSMRYLVFTFDHLSVCVASISSQSIKSISRIGLLILQLDNRIIKKNVINIHQRILWMWTEIYYNFTRIYRSTNNTRIFARCNCFERRLPGKKPRSDLHNLLCYII